MLKAKKHRWMARALEAYILWRVRRQFHALYLSGRLDVLEEGNAYPLILYANHQSWWDGFLMVPLLRRYGMDYFLMMEERNLRKFPLFRRLGVFGVDVGNPAGERSSLLYALRLLRQLQPEAGRRALILFPHGRLVEAIEPWPPFQKGLGALIHANKDGSVVPLYLHLRMGKYPRPEAFLRIGDPVAAGVLHEDAALAAKLVETRDSLYRDIRENYEAATTLLLLAPPVRFRGKT